MTEAMHVPAWGPKGDKDRIASTLDIREELKVAKPYSFEEYSLCFEAALDNERPISERERYLLARFGREYTDSPDQFNEKLDDLEKRLAACVGEFVLIQESSAFVFIERLASPNLHFTTRISGHGDPYGVLGVETSSSISTIIDDHFEIVPELTRDFVNVRNGFRTIAEGTTRRNTLYFDNTKDKWILDSKKPYEHEGDEFLVRIGLDEIQQWQRDNLRWAPHAQNMMEAWNTGLINIPVAEIKLKSPLGESSLAQVVDDGPQRSLLES